MSRTEIPLSYAQESIWLLDRVSRERGDPAYNEPLAFRIRGELDVPALGAALREVIEHHEALRTNVLETPGGLRGTVRDGGDVLTVVDLRHRPPTAAAREADEVLADDLRRPFDLTSDLLLRGVLVRLPGGESRLGLTVHHIATDDWSIGLIVDELGRRYRAARQGARIGPPTGTAAFADYVRAERRAFERGGFDEKIATWKAALDGGTELLRMPLDRPRPAVATFSGSSTRLSLPKERISPLLERCRRECRATGFSVFLAAYAVLLNRYTGQDSVTVATTVLNRGEESFLDVVGCFVNTVALAVDVDEDASFRDLLARSSALSRQMLSQGDAPYPKVLERLDFRRDPSHAPVFQTMLTMMGSRPVPGLGPDVPVERHPLPRAAAKFEILLYVSEESDGFDLEVEYNTDLYSPATMERFLRHFAALLDALAGDIDAPISMVSFTPADEREVILHDWNDTAVGYPENTVVDFFETQVANTPAAVAVEFEGRALTYDELNRAVNRVARSIAKRRAGGASPFIGVYLERSLEMVIALLAIVKAGCAYVPIDPEYPGERVAFMVEDSQVPMVLTQETHRNALGDVDTMVVSADDLPREDDENLRLDLAPDDPVYMIYTSGSTGRPKGAINRHVSLFNRLYWMQEAFGLTDSDRVLQKTPFAFDVSVWEFFWPLMFGARIVVARPGGHRDADYMKRLIERREVTTVHFIPSILNVFLEEDELSAHCGSLRRVICSGEALPHTSVQRFFARLSCELHNLYGPTEAAIDVSHWPCTTDYPGAVVPIGKPIANTQLYVVDKHLALQPIGVPGELCIGGIQLAVGYHNRPELTDKVFVPNPYGPDRLYRTGDLARFLPDGQIQYLGRIDNQIKLRGVRIEPEEISAAICELPGVKDAAVVVHESGNSRMLVAYVVSPEFDQQRIKGGLKTRLPEFMVPQIVIGLPGLPTTPNGKLDRRALPRPGAPVEESPVGEAPSDEYEQAVVQVFRELLGDDRIGADGGFFGYGGDSILTIRAAASLRDLGYPVEVQDILTHPTARRLAAATRDRRPEKAPDAIAPLGLLTAADRELLPDGVLDAWPLTRLQSGMIYHAMLAEGTSIYHDVFDYELRGPIRRDLLEQAFRLVTDAHPILRSTVDLAGFSVPLQLVHADPAVSFEVVDLSARPAEEQDEIVRRWGEAERHRPFDLGAGPLIRVRAHVRGDRALNLTLSFHHALLDGWSVAVVLEEFRRAYADLVDGTRPQLPAEPVAYGTFVGLERAALDDPAAREFWTGLTGGRPPTLLGAGKPTADAPEPATTERPIPAADAASLRDYAAHLGLPLKSVYLAIHLTVLGRLTDRRDVVTGLVSSGRPEVTGGENLAGLFLNTLPFPIRLRQEGWSALIERVFAAEARSAPYRRFPLAEIERQNGGSPLFDVIFNYTDFHVYSKNPDDRVRIVRSRYFEQTNFDAVVHLHHDHFTGHLNVIVNHERSRVDDVIAGHYLDHFLEAAAELAAVARDGADPAEEQDSVAPPLPSQPADVAPASGAEPRTAAERKILGIVAQAAGRTGFGVDDNYLDHGIDSITAISVVAKLRRLNPGVALADVFERRTVRALAERVDRLRPGGDADLRPVGAFELAGTDRSLFPADVVDAYPATSLQLDMIAATDRDPGQARYHDVFAYRLAVPLDGSRLHDALRDLLRRHETLRTSFAFDEYPVPMQLVHDQIEPELRIETDIGDSAFDDWFDREKASAFRWDRPGLIRFFAHSRGAEAFTLTVSFHHAVIDGWSLSVFMRDLVRTYARGETVPEPAGTAPSYRDFVRTELQTRGSQVAREFWARTMADAPPMTLVDRSGAARDARWSETAVAIDDTTRRALSKIAAKAGTSLKHVLLACHLSVLGELTGAADVTTGVFTNGRLEVEGAEDTVGLFLNFVPLRQDIARRTWGELIPEVFEQDHRAMPHRRYPLDLIRRASGRDDLFSAIFNYTQFKTYAELPELTGIRWFEHTEFPLLVNVGHDLSAERVVITLNADGRQFVQEWVEDVGAAFSATINRLVNAGPDAPVSSGGPL